MAKQTRKQAVEQRTEQRLAARQEAAQRGVETRRRNREAQGTPQSRKAQEPAPAAAQAAEAQEQPQAAHGQTRRHGRAVPSTSPRLRSGHALGTGAHDKGASEAMVTVALRGESAQRLRALAAAREMTLSKLLVRMMEVFEGQAAS